MPDTPDSTETTDAADSGAPHKAGAFDIRNIIGLLMAVYGVILTLAGIFGDQERDKTGDVNANLWTGLALILVAAFFLGWARLKPIVVPTDVEGPDDDPTRPAPQRKRPPVH
jgi:hypothetical protein